MLLRVCMWRFYICDALAFLRSKEYISLSRSHSLDEIVSDPGLDTQLLC